MAAPIPNETSKEARIVEAALRILRDGGDRGLTMRRIAREVGMSLSNVQYYFRDKDQLLVAMVGSYTESCATALDARTEELAALDLDERRRRLLADGLSHGHHVTEMCAIFREMWAIGGRNPTVAEALIRYYRAYAAILAKALLPADASAASQARLALLVLPYLEGYSVTGSALGPDPDAALELLMEMIEVAEKRG